MNMRFLGLLAATFMTASVAAQQELHIYNWSDYIAEDTIANFEKTTGIKVTYDVYDSNEILEAKLLAGHSGYDLVFPTARPFADRHLQADLYQMLDKSKLSHLDNLDPVILKSLTDIDTGNNHLVPYMWGTTGIAYNADKVKAILGNDMPLDTWRLVFDPAITSKLATCGVALMDDSSEVFMATRVYQGKKADDFSSASVKDAATIISAVRGDIRYFHNSQTINDMANGDICVAMGYSGDMLQAKDRADEAGNGVHLEYIVPKEGAGVWTDVAAIPKDARNPVAAHQFINYLLQPEVIAPITDFVAYANANRAATPLVDEAVRNNPGVYPPAETQARLVAFATPTDKELRNMNRTWTRVKTGQ
jgi:putrescine transport system substrate-binding protein